MAHVPEKFASLQGATLGELNRSFNKFLQDISSLQQTELTLALDQIAPRNLQEELLHVQLLLKFGAYEALENVLFRCNKILNKKLSQNQHFIKHIAQQSPKDFCERICPEISYVTRIKIINRLPEMITDTNIGEAYFDAIKERYGVRTASKLITSCGEDYILKALDEYDIILSDRQLIKLYIKYPNIVLAYFNEERNFANHKKFAQYLAINDIKLFCKLIKFGVTAIGRKASVYFLKQHKNAILDDPKFYQDIITPRIVNTVLTLKESIAFFMKLLPEFIDDFNLTEAERKFLEAMPMKTRGEILFTAFKQNYDFEYDDNFVDQSVLEIITPQDRKRFKLEENFVHFMSPDVALPLIKKKISFTGELGPRTALVGKLLENCKYNKDYDALLDVLQYFCNHHKNDVQQMREIFLSTLRKSFKLQKLTEQHWKYIDDIIKIIDIHDDHSGGYWMLSDIFEVRIHFKYLNSLNYKEDVTKMLENRTIYSPWITSLPMKIRREFIPNAAEYLKTLNEDDQNAAVHSFFNELLKYNLPKKNKPISMFDYKDFIDLFFNDFRVTTYKYSWSLKYLMKTACRNNEEEAIMLKLIENYFEICSYNDSDNINIWFLKNKPQVVVEHSKKYFENEKFNLGKEFFYQASKIPTVAKKFTEIATAILNSNETIAEEKTIALKFLAYVDDFIKFAENYRPNEDCKIDIEDESIKDKLIIQKAVIKSITTVPLAANYISEVMHYCKGDYLVHATSALSSIMYHISENLIFAPIDILFRGRLSVRGRALHLMAHLGPAQYIKKTLGELGENQDNKSIGKFIFKRTFLSFSKYPNDVFFNLLVNHFTLLNEIDEESWKMMLVVDKIPSSYQSSYVKIMWGYAKTRNLQFDMLPLIKKKVWNKLERNICESIITSTLFDEKNGFPMAELVYEYLLSGGDLNIIYAIERANEIKLCELLQEITIKIINDSKRKQLRLKLISKLLEGINSLPIKRNKYPLEILFESCKFLLEIEDDIISPLAYYMVQKQETAIQKCGHEIASYFRDFALKFLKTAFEGEGIKDMEEGKLNNLMLKTAEKVAEYGETTHIKLLALHILPRNKTKDQKFIKKRQEVLDTISNNCDLSVKVNLAYVYFTQDI